MAFVNIAMREGKKDYWQNYPWNQWKIEELLNSKENINEYTNIKEEYLGAKNDISTENLLKYLRLTFRENTSSNYFGF